MLIDYEVLEQICSFYHETMGAKYVLNGPEAANGATIIHSNGLITAFPRQGKLYSVVGTDEKSTEQVKATISLLMNPPEEN